MQKPRVQNPTLKTFGARLKAARLGVKLTQEALAESLDLSVAYVSCLERGTRNPPLLTVVQLADATGVKPGDLIPEAA